MLIDLAMSLMQRLGAYLTGKSKHKLRNDGVVCLVSGRKVRRGFRTESGRALQ